jgi:hypothetical protein
LFSEYGFVKVIELPFNNLRGSIPASIKAFKQLRRLDLSGNFLSGSIPSSLFDLEQLQELDLSRNFLTGTVSPDVKKLTNLIKLSLAVNRFDGELPWSIGYLKNLDVLLLHRNNFTGGVPFSLSSLTNLSSIDLTNNQLSEWSNLPATMCTHCERFVNQCNRYGCSKCKDGQLLSCHNPNKILLRHGLPTNPEDYEARLKLKAQIFPEECGYHFG